MKNIDLLNNPAHLYPNLYFGVFRLNGGNKISSQVWNDLIQLGDLRKKYTNPTQVSEARDADIGIFFSSNHLNK